MNSFEKMLNDIKDSVERTYDSQEINNMEDFDLFFGRLISAISLVSKDKLMKDIKEGRIN